MARTKKKQKKSVLPLLFGAILLGGLAAALSMLYLKSREAAIRASLEGPAVQNVAVVVAKTNLPKGTTVTEQQFAVREVPQDYVPVDAITPGEFDGYTGRVLVQVVGLGKPLLKSYLSDSFPVDFSDIIPKGHRAMTVTVDEVNSVAGNIRPGNHIDIYVNIPYKESGFNAKVLKEGKPGLIPASLRATIPPALLGTASKVAEEVLAAAAPSDVILPVAQNVRVLATGQDTYRETLDRLRQPQRRTEQTFTSVTLDISPDQAALLDAAQDKGDLMALLRNRNDASLADFTTLSARDLFSNAQKMASKEQRRKAAANRPTGVDAEGNLVNARGETLMSKEQLAAAGLHVNEKGQIVDANGNVVDPSELVVGAHGKLMTKEQLAKAGLHVNENGEIVDASGKVVNPDDVVVGADGKVLTRAQLAVAGLHVNEKGEIVNAKGEVVDPNSLIMGKDGSIVSKAELAKAGLHVNENGEIVNAKGEVVSGPALAEALGRPEPPGEKIDLIIGGASEDGVAKIKKLPAEAEE